MVKMNAKPPVARAATTPLNPNPLQMNSGADHTQNQRGSSSSSSGYEQCREERIKENMERMQKLGILDLSLKLKSCNTNTTPRNRNRRTPQHVTPLPPSGPTRRSSRLQNSTPVSYAENHPPQKDIAVNSNSWFLEEGSKPEIYTEEHEKLLSETNMSWTLFVDGYGKDGKRIYDSARGKTCHQCRQKTLGHRTHCSKCNMVQGQFCGDCLYMRYGENVLEANQNPNWICPPCRGICNCSLCRKAKGWAPTGILYKKITNLGFKSVAHYLIQTQRLEKSSGSKLPVSAKRSLPFSDIEATSNESPDSNNDLQGLEKAKSEDKITKEDARVLRFRDGGQGLSSASSEDKANDLSVTTEKKDNMQYLDDKLCDRNIECERSIGYMKERQATTETSDVHVGILNCEEKKADGQLKRKKETNKPCHGNVTMESTPGSKKKSSLVTEPQSDSIAGRLRQRRGKGCEPLKLELVQMNEQTLSSAQLVEMNGSTSITPEIDSIGRRLRQRRKCT